MIEIIGSEVNLKSNMDRFIADKVVELLKHLENLKSNMDRFIVLQ